MKYLIFVSLLLCSAAYAADEPKVQTATCGKTVEDCQKVLDNQKKTDDAQFQRLNSQLQIYKGLLTEANDRLVAAASK